MVGATPSRPSPARGLFQLRGPVHLCRFEATALDGEESLAAIRNMFWQSTRLVTSSRSA